MSELARLLVALGSWVGVVLICAAISGRERTRRWTPLVASLALAAPLALAPSWIVARGVATMLGVVAFGRSLDLARRRGALSFWGRAWLMIALFDVRAVERTSPSFDGREALRLAICVGLCAAGWIGVFELAPGHSGARAWALRWGFGLVLVYTSFESVHSTLLFAYRGLGLRMPRINDDPVRSTTLAEFWGRRWNRVVSGWLRDYLFFPLARRRRPKLGILAAFAGSTVLHFWFAWVPLDLLGGAMMASFFLVHGAGLVLERELGVARWRVGAQRAWLAAWFIVPVPLFVEPAMRLFAGFIRG